MPNSFSIFEVLSGKGKTTLVECVNLPDLMYQNNIYTNKSCDITFMIYQSNKF